MNQISNWTNENQMQLNNKKTKIMIFNFTHNYQFTTRIFIQESLLDIIDEIKLLGVTVTSDLKWNQNTNTLVRKSYARMQILRKLYGFSVPIADLIKIYIIYVRSLLEISCVVWASSLTEQQITKLERIQKVALRIILGDSYQSYENALAITKLQTLHERRKDLCLKFAKKCLKNNRANDIFPLNTVTDTATRHREKYFVQMARTDRLAKSAVPYMQRLLNNQ